MSRTADTIDPNLRTANLYQVYASLAEASFWLPVFFLYPAAYLPLDAVLLLESIYFLSVVVIEVPSGWFSDRLGRRPTMIIGGTLMAASHALMFLGPTLASGEAGLYSGLFVLFAVALFLRAGGMAFRSGTDTALHFDALKACGRQDEFAAREARASRRRFYGASIAALVGGGVALIDLRTPYILSFLAALGILFTAVRMSEPPPDSDEPGRSGVGLFRQIGRCAAQWKHGVLLLLFLYAALMLVLNHIPYVFFQPYIEAVIGSEHTDLVMTPFVAGVHVAVTFWIAGWIGARSIRIRDRIGLWGVLCAATLLQTALIGLMWMWVSIPVMLLLLLRSCPRALMTAPLNAAITGVVPRSLRATYLSMQSLVGRLSFSLVLFLLTLAVPMAAKAMWSDIHVQIGLCAVGSLAGLCLVVLVLAVRGRRDDVIEPLQSAS